MTAQGGYGVKLKITISSVLTAIVGIQDPTFPNFKKFLGDATSHPTSGATGWVERVDSGLREGEPFECTLLWDSTDSTHAAVVAAFTATDPVEMSIEDPAGNETITFDAFIESIGRMTNTQGEYSARVRISPTGELVIT